MIEIEKDLIINIPRREIEGTWSKKKKKPRLFKTRPNN